MKFRTEVEVKPFDKKVSYTKPSLWVGSCFSNRIGTKLERLKFNTCINPFGIIFNPISLFKNLSRLIEGKSFVESELFEHDGLWHSWDHHGSFSAKEKPKVLEKINEAFEEAASSISHCEYLFLTLGTAWVYKKDGQVVANCHKVPNNQFTKELAHVKEITNLGNDFLAGLFKLNPNAKVVITVSPVRHWKDGAEENNLSKSMLRVASHYWEDAYKQASYFPSFELMMDDLRDYRFYQSDMLHPSDDALEYIWGKFAEAAFDDKTRQFVGELDKVIKIREHRPIHGNGTESSISEKLESLKKKYPDYPISL